MPIAIADFPAAPECGGTQWTVEDVDRLATLVGTVLVGRARHAARVLQGVQHNAVNTSVAQREVLREQLHPQNDGRRWHRDGLLFEIICWLTARMTADHNEVISDPHLSSTQQGADTLRLRFDRATRLLVSATICEQKCTTSPRDHFRDSVVPAFKEWMAGRRDNQLVSLATGLLTEFNLSDDELTAVYDRLVRVRPLAFRVALTVTPAPFATAQCVATFADYQSVTPMVGDRNGDTLPLEDVRGWFNEFSALVWAKIEAENV